MKWLIAVLVTAVVATPAYAGPTDDSRAAEGSGIRASVERVRFDGDSRGWSYVPLTPSPGNATVARKAAAAIGMGVLGMLGGIYAGGWLAATLAHGCRCEDAALQGALIGMPIGAAAGGFAGWRLAR